jgi:hypothetical protein
MRITFGSPLWRVLLWGWLLLCALMPAAQAQERVFRDEELDQMLAPIALYPDALLSQILMASTYPADVREAAEWSRQRPDLKGDAAVKQVERMDWDPAVQSLVAFPQVLAMMRERPGDVQRLGDAFLADPGLVMDRVQFLRRKAQQAGNLKTNPQQTVVVQTEAARQVIVIEPAQPQTVYVPVYQPTVVYGTWWYPTYPPYYWPPPPYYYPPRNGAFVAGFIWGAAIVGIHHGMWGGFHWGRNQVNINVNHYNTINVNRPRITNNNFVHNPQRRGDVPYRDTRSREQFGKKAVAGANDRQAFRGKDGRDNDRARASQAIQSRGIETGAATRDRPGVANRPQQTQGATRDRPQGAGTIERPQLPARDPQQAAPRDRLQVADRLPNAPAARPEGTRDRPAPQGDRAAAGGALSGVRDPGNARADADRGRASREALTQRRADGPKGQR